VRFRRWPCASALHAMQRSGSTPPRSILTSAALRQSSPTCSVASRTLAFGGA
jgi:hypothetical protein